jgi:hypothetical protein
MFLSLLKWLACTNFEMVGCMIQQKHIFLEVDAEESLFENVIELLEAVGI